MHRMIPQHVTCCFFVQSCWFLCDHMQYVNSEIHIIINPLYMHNHHTKTHEYTNIQTNKQPAKQTHGIANARYELEIGQNSEWLC